MKMSPFSINALLLLLSSTSLTLASRYDNSTYGVYFEVPNPIVADTDVKIHVPDGSFIRNTQASSQSAYEGDFDAYRVVLTYIDPDNPDIILQCTLNQTPFHPATTSGADITIRIPSSIGPAGPSYFIDIVEYISAAVMDSCEIYITEYDAATSSFFYFTGATGKYSQGELDGNRITYDSPLPCTALGCARNCTEAFYPANKNAYGDNILYKSTFECIAACPGNTHMTWDEHLTYYTSASKCGAYDIENGPSSTFISSTYGTTLPTDSGTFGRPSMTTTSGATKATDSASAGTIGSSPSGSSSTHTSSTSASTSISTTSAPPTRTPTPSHSAANHISYDATPLVIVMLWGLCLAISSML